jgi:hypothetical protein
MAAWETMLAMTASYPRHKGDVRGRRAGSHRRGLRIARPLPTEPVDSVAVASACIPDEPIARGPRNATSAPLFNVRTVVDLAAEMFGTAASLRAEASARTEESRALLRSKRIVT